MSDDVASLPCDLVFIGQSKSVHITISYDFELSDPLIVFALNIFHEASAWSVVGGRVHLIVVFTG